jgi:hypothetical protein
MAPFKALYGRRCRTHLNLVEPDERMTFGPDLITEAEEIVHHIQSNLKMSSPAKSTISTRDVVP